MYQITRIVESRTCKAKKQQKSQTCSLKRRRHFRAGGPTLHIRPAAIILFSYSNEIFARQFFKNLCIVLE